VDGARPRHNLLLSGLTFARTFTPGRSFCHMVPTWAFGLEFPQNSRRWGCLSDQSAGAYVQGRARMARSAFVQTSSL